ncbi:MAG: signal recognition particle-docking protein FtsY [Acidobacteria bacterium]|nr:MAG: signal recognition particle-docking protein FtsY [Acidobacteriota bacterium]PYQ65297.1 MAG: signal recognition particle-docking protein FtsY [Acidobacteriota bacterium]
MTGKSAFFSKVRRGLFMTHTEILEKLGDAVKKGFGFDETVLESLEEVLLEADVGAETAGALADAMRRRGGSSSGADLAELKRVLVEEIEAIISRAPRPAAVPDVPLEVIFLVGVNGSGKTTTTAKLAAREIAAGRPVLLAAADTFRAGAIEQLEVWADRLEVPIVRHREGADPSAVLFDALAAAKARGTKKLFVDTAGRLHTKKNLMEELAKMRRIAAREVSGAPHQVLLVLDATTGMNGLEQARRFVEAAGATGVVLTKLDGSARGGIVLAIYRELALPVVFVGVGEAVDDLVPFDPAEYAKALLEDGAGDEAFRGAAV